MILRFAGLSMRIATQARGSRINIAWMATDSGGGCIPDPDPIIEDPETEAAYDKYMRNIVEDGDYAGPVDQISAKYVGEKHVGGFVERVIDGIADEIKMYALETCLEYILTEGTMAGVLPAGDYQVYEVIVASHFYEDSILIHEYTIYTFSISDKCCYFPCEKWHTYPYPEQLYFMPG